MAIYLGDQKVNMYLGDQKILPSEFPEPKQGQLNLKIEYVFVEGREGFFSSTYLASKEGFYIDWGDGTFTDATTPPEVYSGNYGHDYKQSGEYIICLSGEFIQLSFQYSMMQQCLIEVLEGSVMFSGLVIENDNALNGYFYSCKKLTKVPEGLFKLCGNAKSIGGLFNGCESLLEIPSDILSYFVTVESLDDCFSGCSSLKVIPDDLFRYNREVKSFWGTFKNCLSLTHIPKDLFKYNTKAYRYLKCFMNSFDPDFVQDSFDLDIELKQNLNISEMFSGCRIKNIGHLTINVHTGSGTYYDISNVFKGSFIETIGSITIASSYALKEWFTESSLLKTIGNIHVNDEANLNSMFLKCPELETVGSIEPTGEGKNVAFNSLFKDCTKLSSMGDIVRFFKPSVSSMFYNCTVLPFVNFTGVVHLESDTFKKCSNIEIVRGDKISIPHIEEVPKLNDITGTIIDELWNTWSPFAKRANLNKTLASGKEFRGMFYMKIEGGWTQEMIDTVNSQEWLVMHWYSTYPWAAWVSHDDNWKNYPQPVD